MNRRLFLLGFVLLALGSSFGQAALVAAQEELPAEPVLAPGTPLRLVQPRLGIDAPIVPVGVTEDGSMAAPTDPTTVGWWSLGVDAEPDGNVVLAAHVNWGGINRVFALLHLAEPGEVFYLTDAAGVEHGYLVTWVRSYDANNAPLEEIFLPDAAGHQLTLITCGGRYDAENRQYLDRWVVRAQRIVHNPIEPSPDEAPPLEPESPPAP